MLLSLIIAISFLFYAMYFYNGYKIDVNKTCLQTSLESVAANNILSKNILSKKLTQPIDFNTVWFIVKFKKSTNNSKKIEVEKMWMSNNVLICSNNKISFTVDNKNITLDEDYIFMLFKKDKWTHSNFKKLLKK